MFDRGRYDHMRFDAAISQTGEIRYQAAMAEAVHCAITNGRNHTVVIFAAEQAYCHAARAEGIPHSAAMREDIRQQTALKQNAFLLMQALESAHATAYATVTVHYEAAIAEAARVDAYMSLDRHRTIALKEAASSAAYLSNNYAMEPTPLYSLWSAEISTRAFEYLEATFAVDIPPGGVLVIDAITFNVLLNGQNVIRAHKGAWLNRLDRSTHSVIFRPGSGTMNAHIEWIYDERWF